MIRVALYARYSSEHQKESSITDQFRNCEQRAAREGWTITARYEDKAISGTTADRPGYQAMLTDAKAKQFDILLVDDLSRLSRDSVESEQARRRFVFWKIRLIGVTDNIDTSIKGHEMMSGFHGLINQQYVSGMADKISRGLKGQALKGFHCGGRTYGYKLVPEYDLTKTDPDGNPIRLGTKLAINPEQAKWVKWIFERYADGMSPAKIVNELNRLQVPAPGAAYRRRKHIGTPTWPAASLQGSLSRGTGLLCNPLYIGQYCWNRMKREKDPDTKSRTHEIRDRHEWIEVAVPHLRIIDETLWKRAQAARANVSREVSALRAVHRRGNSTGARPKYLFSGLLVCAHCGGKYVISSTTTYVCSTWRTRGDSVCPNAIKVARTLVESVLLAAIQKDLFTDEGLTVFKQAVARRLAEHRRTRRPDGAKDAARLKEVEQEIEHIMTAIKAGIFTASTKAALEQAEAEHDTLIKTVQGRTKALDKVVTFLPDIERRFKALVDGLATVTQYQVDKARGILRDLMGGTIPLHPTTEGAIQYLTAEVSGDYAGLARLILGPRNILNPANHTRYASLSG